MPSEGLLSRLRKSVLVCDGAMGTQLMARGLATGACGELWNVQRPDDVRAIHIAYKNAGCDLLTTNTFGGSTVSLQRHGHDGQADELNRAGAAVARQAAGADAYVLGDIGPFGGFLEPLGDVTAETLLEIFLKQAKALRAGGADAAVVETMSDPAELAIGVRAAKQAADWPVIATYSFAHGDAGSFRTMMGTTVADAVSAALDAGADVVGTNCGTSLSLADYLRLAEQLVAAARSTPVIVQPNAGSPKTIDGKLVYDATPQQMAELAKRLVGVGVKIVGGCCGTTPAHLAAMAAELKK